MFLRVVKLGGVVYMMDGCMSIGGSYMVMVSVHSLEFGFHF